MFLTFVVILFTLVGQGLSLPAVIRRLQISDGGADADEELHARLVATKAALGQIDALAGEDWTRDETVERMRAWYEYRSAAWPPGPARSRTRATRIALWPTRRWSGWSLPPSARRYWGYDATAKPPDPGR